MSQTTNELRALVAEWQRQADYLTRPDSDGDAPTEGDYGCARGLYAAADELHGVLARHEQAQGGMADDSARLDALEAFVRDNGGLVLHDHDARGNYAGLGLACTRRTLREAIDGAFRPSADARQETQG